MWDAGLVLASFAWSPSGLWHDDEGCGEDGGGVEAGETAGALLQAGGALDPTGQLTGRQLVALGGVGRPLPGLVLPGQGALLQGVDLKAVLVTEGHTHVTGAPLLLHITS